MFTPLVNYGADKGGKRVGVVGIGGLGQMGVRLAKAMGNTVTAISTSPSKEAAAKEIGADNFVVSTDPKSLKAAAGSLDLIINTVSADHDINIYLPLLVSNVITVAGDSQLFPGREGSLCPAGTRPEASLHQPTPAAGQEPHRLRLHYRRSAQHPEGHRLLSRAQHQAQGQAHHGQRPGQSISGTLWQK